MPTYNYICLGCDKKISIFQNMNDEPISNCEYCKKPRDCTRRFLIWKLPNILVITFNRFKY